MAYGALVLGAAAAAGVIVETTAAGEQPPTLVGVAKDSLVAFFLLDSCGILSIADSHAVREQMPVRWKSPGGRYEGRVKKVVRHVSLEPAGDVDYYEYGLVDAGAGRLMTSAQKMSRPVNVSTKVYLPILKKDYEKKRENTCTLHVLKAYKYDFDGNRTDEVLFCTRSDGCGDIAGATIIGVRYIENDSVGVTIIARHKAQTLPQGTCYYGDIDLAFADVNFDGRCEIFYRFADYRCHLGMWDTYTMIQYRNNTVIDRRVCDIDRLVEMYAE